MNTGQLIMAANSLGNPADIPVRALEALKAADLVVFEEDRIARATLKAAGIHRDYLRLNEHRDESVLVETAASLKAGKTVVYMCDQGTPNFADPGGELLNQAYGLGSKVSVIPGPNSVSAALAACPFPMVSFRYLGFPKRKTEELQKQLAKLAESREGLIILDTPYRRARLLEECCRAFGKNRRAFLALDISGEQEEFVAGTLASISREEISKKLNFVLIISSR